MRAKMIFVLLVLYGTSAGLEYDPAGWRVILQPATRGAAEVYWQPVDPDLAPPYLLYDTRTLVVPYVTGRGRELAGRRVARDVPQVRRQVRNGQAVLDRVPAWPVDDEHVMSGGPDPRLNRIVVVTDTVDQGLRRRAAESWGELVVIEWDPFAAPLKNL
ncbi:hypothetical protein [Nonomuraea sp. KM90]|uniref:hypothetical protein n=1 Tax=Nonomuraea sp. KM90 TaxID=3457428 RepID=UPI003FCD4364